ncbi:MAG: ABC transporter substrate-binding protein [Sphingobacteriia bacterium]|nr:ABC transporter substrate-binding protein [Sphingobacteriia bacterium]NCC41053.1 ABC transporter substrate-binding protein [Gammaproteobacteria bacterium]
MLVAVLVLAGLLAIGAVAWLSRDATHPIRVGLGIDLPVIYGAVIDPSDKNTADLFMEEHPDTRIRIFDMYNDARPQTAAPDLEAAIQDGVRFFVTTHASSHAVPSLHLFADGRALGINVASTSLLLTEQDDYLLRIIPDLRQEQLALARQVARWPGRRILVLQDTGNLAWSDPAFTIFSGELAHSGRWSITHHKLRVVDFVPDDLAPLMAAPFDALYILAGTFMPPIGNLAQLFHHHHPEAPILLTHWARSPAVLEQAGSAIDRLVLLSPYPSRFDDPAVDEFFRRFSARFGYEPQAMSIGTRQALELLDHAFSMGYETPDEVKRYLLTTQVHQTSLGTIAFDRFGDLSTDYHVLTDLRRERQ